MDKELRKVFEDFWNSVDELDASLRKYCKRNIEENESLNKAIKEESNAAIENQNKIWETLR